MSSSVVADEVRRFDALAQQWWNPRGPMAPLHAMNPLRTAWADRHIRAAIGGPARLLDIGCGAGLASEAMARLGHDVLGIDAAPEVIQAARAHADGQGLTVSYRCMTAEALLAEGARFQAITALEVIEHVADPQDFLASLAGLLEPGGVLVLSTLNRTRRSWMTAKLGAEYLLRMLPVGTHAWRQFITPAELSGMMRNIGLRTIDAAGMGFNPLTGTWRATRDTSVNYILAGRRD
jgi:2-polyprenyl-6-hydroxyphenyl methylase/3-demethylubiquinone-9 3-methyltransferase